MVTIKALGFIRKTLLAALAVTLAATSGGIRSSLRAAEEPHALDEARLKSVHDQLLAAYAAERKKFSNTPVATLSYSKMPVLLDDFYLHLATTLEQAGVRALLDERKTVRMPTVIQAEILNDYGFWLSKTRDPKRAIPVIQRVTEIAPARAIAQLNLADTIRSALPLAVTWEQKTNLAKIGLKAYSDYQTITATHLSAAAEFESLYANPAVSKDVCSYVAAFYDRGREGELWGYPDPVDITGDGKLRHVYIFDEGTAHIPVIFSSTKAIPEEDRFVESFNKDEVDFERTDLSGDQQYGSWPALHMLPFKDGYYLVYQEDHGPVAVVKPNAGTVCRFKRSFKAELAEDHDPAICREVLAGKTFDKIPDKPLLSEEIHVDDSLVSLPGDTPHFRRYSDVKLDPGGTAGRIGYYEFFSGAGPGCDLYGIAFIDGDHLEGSTRSKAIIDTLDQMKDCRGSTAFIVQAHGQNLIEWDGGHALQRQTPPRTLLRLAGDKIETVCRLEQRPTYILESTPR